MPGARCCAGGRPCSTTSTGTCLGASPTCGADEDGYDTQSDDVNEPERKHYPHLQGGHHPRKVGHRTGLSRAWGLTEDDDEPDDELDDEDERDDQHEKEDRPMSKPAVETYYENGTWRSRHEGVSRPFATGGTKAEQVAKGRETARKEKVEHIIKNRDGTISERNSYGNDPNPPKG